MRIVIWNCNMKLHGKIDRLLSLKPDIAMLPECASPKVLREKAALFVPEHYEWIPGSSEQKGLGVMAFGEYALHRHHDVNPEFRFILPLHVNGPVTFSLLAVWAITYSGEVRHSDRGPVLRALEHYHDFLTCEPAVIAGDFNNHVVSDRPRRACNHSNTLEEMTRLKMFSAYHQATGESPGEEKTPTQYQQRDLENSFHLDYCFLSEQWRPLVQQVEVGAAADWLPQSGHMPMVIDIEI